MKTIIEVIDLKRKKFSCTDEDIKVVEDWLNNFLIEDEDSQNILDDIKVYFPLQFNKWIKKS